MAKRLAIFDRVLIKYVYLKENTQTTTEELNKTENKKLANDGRKS